MKQIEYSCHQTLTKANLIFPHQKSEKEKMKKKKQPTPSFLHSKPSSQGMTHCQTLEACACNEETCYGVHSRNYGGRVAVQRRYRSQICTLHTPTRIVHLGWLRWPCFASSNKKKLIICGWLLSLSLCVFNYA